MATSSCSRATAAGTGTVHTERFRAGLLPVPRALGLVDSRTKVARLAVEGRVAHAEQLTPLIGREREHAEVCQLLRAASVRLVTLTGPGGIGKTRLGTQVARDLASEFGDGVCFVSLGSLDDPALVGPAVAEKLGVRERGDAALHEQLQAFLWSRRLLLLLDNFEHLLPAAPLVAQLLAECPLLKVLVTSRAALRISAEHEFALTPLELPPLERGEHHEAIAASPAVALFARRARASRPDFRVTADNARVVAQICARVDALPLAIELAAVWIRLLSPEELLGRLDRPLDLLTHGPRDLPERQQELRATIGWSYRLLAPHERRVLRGLAVFAGGCSLPQAEEILGAIDPSSIDVLDGLVSLADHGLVQRTQTPEGQTRLEMLATIREFALAELDASADAESARAAHARSYIRFAEEAERRPGPTQELWVERLARDHANLRAALRWSLDHGQAEAAVRLCNGLWRFWLIRGHLREGDRWLDQALTAYGRQCTPARVRALVGAGMVASYLEDEGRAAELLDESIALCRQLDDSEGLVLALTGRGLVARKVGDLSAARALYHEALAGGPEGGHAGYAVPSALQGVAWLAFWEGDEDEAARLFAESLTTFEELGDRQQAAGSLYGLGQLASRRGDHEHAQVMCQRALELAAELNDRWLSSICLEGMGRAAVAAGRVEDGVSILSAADGARQDTGMQWTPFVRADYERTLASARAVLSEDAFAAAWAASPSLIAGQATTGTGVAGRPPSSRDELTARELEVLQLVSEGLSDGEVARRLVVSPRTVHSHLRSIYRKLGVSSRSAATRYAVEHELTVSR